MIKTAGRATPILNYICVILLFALLALQLMPGYWTNADNVETSPVAQVRSVSIQQLVWFPANTTEIPTPGTDMVKYFEAKYTTYDCENCGYQTLEAQKNCPECNTKNGVKKNVWEVADIATMPALLVALCIITFFFGIKKPTRLWMNIVYLLAGILALVTYLTQPIFQLNSQWVIHAAVSGALILASIANIAFRPWKKIMHFMKTGE